MPSGRLLLDHSIVGSESIGLTVRKDRNLAACRVCGSIFQPRWLTDASDLEYAAAPDKLFAAEEEILNWRRQHNRKHTDAERKSLQLSGLSFTPEAAHRLAPFGIAPVTDSILNEETHIAMTEAPRAPVDDVDTSLRNLVGGFYK